MAFRTPLTEFLQYCLGTEARPSRAHFLFTSRVCSGQVTAVHHGLCVQCR